MTTSFKLWVNNELYPQETSVATLYRVLPRLQLDLFTITSFPRKLAECLYSDVSPPLILPVLSRFIEFTCHYTVVQSPTVCTVIQITFIHTFIQLYIHTLILSHVNAYTSYTQYQITHDCISHSESCLGRVSTFRSLLVIVSSRKFLQRNIFHLPSCHQKWYPKCVWSRDVAHYKPVGFQQFFFWSPMDSGEHLRNLIKSRVDSRKCLSKAEWILANAYQKAEWILANAYQKSSGFSHMLIKSRVDSRECLSKAEWILANVLPCRVDSRKSCAKPSGFWRNLLRNQVDFRQTFISQTDSLQVFFFLSKRSSPVCLVQRCHQSKHLFLQTISLQIHFKIPQCRFKVLFPFIYLHTTINTVVDNHVPQWNYSIP